METAREQQGEAVTGIPTGLDALDEVTEGWQDGDLIYLGGRPSMGKSSLAIRTLMAAAKRGLGAGLVSAEMQPRRLTSRAIHQEAKVDSNQQTYDSDQMQRLGNAADRTRDLPLFLTEQTGIDIENLVGLFRRMVLEKKCSLLSFDYFQLLQPPSGHRGDKQEYLPAASSRLKGLAKELGVPILVLSQLNRAVENRGGRHRPRLSDLRATGSMEQDADVVIFVHRPEMYGIDIDANGNSTDGIAELLVKKNRNGETGTAVTVFKEEHTNFYDLEPGHDRRAATPDDEAPF